MGEEKKLWWEMDVNVELALENALRMLWATEESFGATEESRCVML